MTKDYKIGYIVLHYQAISETCACIESLRNIAGSKDIIIIIDNHSPNGSGKMLLQKFRHTDNISVILNPKNLGFARGNNIGYASAKYQHGCDFIVMLNNDTLVEQKDFRARIIKAYEIHHFAVMGPKILHADGTTNQCSPAAPVHTSLFRVKIGQVANYIRFLLSICNLDILFGQIIDRHSGNTGLQTDTYQEDVQISGCCIIFSREYIDRFDGLNPNTFLYLEENILYIRVKKAGLKIAYNPELEIIHLEDAATLAVFKGKSVKARRYKYKCQMRSFRALLEEIKKQVD